MADNKAIDLQGLGIFKEEVDKQLSNKSDKSVTVSSVAYNSTSKKITKTINGTTSDVVSVDTLKSAMSLSKTDVGLGSVTNDAQVKRSEMGAANGVATLGNDGKVPSSQLPSYVDDVLEFSKKSEFPTSGEAGKIYIDTSNNTSWRWSGSTYSQVKGDLSLGETSSTAFPGDRGKTMETKLSGIANGAQVNVIETIKVNGMVLTPDKKTVDITIPSVVYATETEIRAIFN